MGLMRLFEGDVVFTRGGGRVSRLIRRYTRSGSEGPTKVNHVGVVVRSENVRYAMIVEALGTGVKRHALWRYFGTKNEVAIFRPDLPRDKRWEVARVAASYEGRAYGYGKLVTQWLDWAIGDRYVFRRLTNMDRFPICSWVVAMAFKAVGVDFGVRAEQATPDDLWDYCLSHPGEWTLIHPLGPLTEVESPETVPVR